MADHTLVKQSFTRAWNDIEPKVLAWITAGGLLTVASVIFDYIYPNTALPVWVAPVVTYLGGLLVAYIKKSSVKVPTSTALAADQAAAGVTAAGTPVAPTLPAPDLTTDTTTPPAV